MENTNSKTLITHMSPFYKAPRHASVERRGKPTKKPYNNYKLCSHKSTKLNYGKHYRGIMTGQGKGAARDLLADPDFVMMDSTSPPQGHKRNGGFKTASEEKRSRAASTEKRNKSAAKEKSVPTPLFWLGFEAMEKLAIEEGATHNLEPIANNTKKGRSDKEAAELTEVVHSYPHVNQTIFPIVRPDDTTRKNGSFPAEFQQNSVDFIS